MQFSIRNWLKEHQIDIHDLKKMSTGQVEGITYRIAGEMEVKNLTPFDICTFVEVLQLPLSKVQEEISILAQITESLLPSLSQIKALKRNEGTWLAFQIAYLQALKTILLQEESLKRLWLDRAKIPNSVESEFLKNHKLKPLVDNLCPGKLTDKQAEQALSLVIDSLLIDLMNNITITWLIINGAEETEAKLLTQRLLHSLPSYLLIVITNNTAPLAQLQKFVRLGNSLSLDGINTHIELSGIVNFRRSYGKIDWHREYYRANLLQTSSLPFFMESFAIKDIYVQPSGLLEDKEKPQLVSLNNWCKQQLNDAKNIIVITGESGYGKTSFCEFFAAEIAWEMYPYWIPVLIRLRDIKYGKTLTETLNSGFELYPNIDLNTWLGYQYPQCLIILDGWDELYPLNQSTRSKRIFIDQLLKLQKLGKHKIIITGKLLEIQQTAPEILAVSQIIAIKPFDIDKLRQWFQNWAMVQSLPMAQNFFNFLKKAGLFTKSSPLPTLSRLVKQPLILYILGVLYRDGLLDEEMLELSSKHDKNGIAFLWETYNRLSCWLLGYPQTEGMKAIFLRVGTNHIHRTPAKIANLLSGMNPQDLLAQMQETALKILHSNHHYICVPILENTDNQQRLPVLYFHTSVINNRDQKQLKIEFSHQILGDYLCAQAIVNQLEKITQFQENQYGKTQFIIESSTNVAEHIYQLLGYGILDENIENLVIQGWRKIQQKSPSSLVRLWQRLEEFWHDYCQSRWLNEGMAHATRNYLQTLNNCLNIEQIKAAVGLNVFLLLCSISELTQITFYPCGNPDNLEQFHPTALIELVSRTNHLHTTAFCKRIVNKSLGGINLSHASLLQTFWQGVNLQNINLSDAELMGANLTNANLSCANLIGANLTGANLTNANLTRANLTGANLTNANLTGANLTGVNLNTIILTNTCMFNAILEQPDKEFAALHGALFTQNDFLQRGNIAKNDINNQNINISADAETEIWISEETEDLKIETVEGEAILSTEIYLNDDQDAQMF